MITRWTAAALSSKLAAREVSAAEVAEAFLKRIEALDGTYGCYITVTRDEALRQAKAAQARIDAGEGGPLAGVPVALKDILSTEGVRTTCASKILENYIPPYDATAVRKLRESGAVILGKTNLDEFAMGASTETSAYGPTRNPWDPERSPGGSSGGSAAAVAAELAPLSLGTDTGGSIRQPAALCGVVGFKPTYGRVSRYGLVAFASSLDQIGPFGRTVEDAALLANAISGHDPRDATSIAGPPIGVDGLTDGGLKGVKLAAPKELWAESLDPGVQAACRVALDRLSKEGAEVREISLPSVRYAVTTYYILAPAEASSNLARFDGIRFGPRSEGAGHIEIVENTRSRGFGHEVKARIMMGTYALSAGYYEAYYHRAQQVRALMRQEFDATFAEFDFIVSPTSPTPAFRIGELSADPLALKLLDACTIPANLGGYPGISLNCGFAGGLPVGFQFVGPRMSDEKLLQAAFHAEQVFDASGRPPVP